MKTGTFFLALLICTGLQAQKNSYWQQQVDYNIYAEFFPKDSLLSCKETIVYKNNSPSTLNFIWFHIWPNAYKNDSTALMKQIKNDEDRKKKLETYGHGYIDGLALTINGKPAKTEPHPNKQYIDIIKVMLDKPLQPGESATIETPFTVKLPPYFSRSGMADGEVMACQWYPKPAVFDKNGWHEFPYLDMGEFYSEYGNYNVHITLPSHYVVAATGILKLNEELDIYKNYGSQNTANRNGSPVMYQPVNPGGRKTLDYYAENVPDFAWFADKNFVIQYDTTRLPGGKIIDLFSFYHNNPKTIWNNSIDYIKDAVQKYSQWIGDYDYPVVQAVEGPKNNSSGGMEYPMVTLITSPDAKVESLDGVITHEVGHNWFMSMLGSNERKHTWMDEGLNSYFQFRYEAEKYRYNSIFGNDIPDHIKKLPTDEFLEAVYNVISQAVPMETAMETPADKFPNSQEYGLVSYVKTALWMHIFEKMVGKEKAELAIKNYFAKWKHKHPQPEDMKAAFEEATNAKLDKFFKLLNKQGKIK